MIHCQPYNAGAAAEDAAVDWEVGAQGIFLKLV